MTWAPEGTRGAGLGAAKRLATRAAAKHAGLLPGDDDRRVRLTGSGKQAVIRA